MTRVMDIERSEQLFDAAFREFAEKGFEEAQLATILKEASIPKATFYYNFSGKDDLLMFVYEEIEKKVSAYTHSWCNDNAGRLENADFFTLLHTVSMVSLEVRDEFPRIYRFLKNVHYLSDFRLGSQVKTKIQEVNKQFIQEHFFKAVEAGQIRRDIDTTRLFEIFLNMLNVVRDIVYGSNDEMDSTDIGLLITDTIEILRHGMSGHEDSATTPLKGGHQS